MILTGKQIVREVKAKRIDISPFDPEQVNPNSYNLRLADQIAWYATRYDGDGLPVPLDAYKDNPTVTARIPASGVVLQPGRLYLANTIERTYTPWHAPMLEGRSSIARLGLTVHQTGGVGDCGFDGQWVLEMSCIHPVRVYAGMPICQVMFFTMHGQNTRYKGRYQGQSGPVACRLWQDKSPG